MGIAFFVTNFTASSLNSNVNLGLGRFVRLFMFTSYDIINLSVEVSGFVDAEIKLTSSAD